MLQSIETWHSKMKRTLSIILKRELDKNWQLFEADAFNVNESPLKGKRSIHWVKRRLAASSRGRSNS